MFLDETAIEEVANGNSEMRNVLENCSRPVTIVCGPTGELIAEHPTDKEGILIADIDLSLIIEQKEIHDIVGYYNRFDIFPLEVYFTPNTPLRFKGLKDSSKPFEHGNLRQADLEMIRTEGEEFRKDLK